MAKEEAFARLAESTRSKSGPIQVAPERAEGLRPRLDKGNYFVNVAKSIGKITTGIVTGVASGVKSQFENAAESIAIAFGAGNKELEEIERNNQIISNYRTTMIQKYREGKINRKQLDAVFADAAVDQRNSNEAMQRWQERTTAERARGDIADIGGALLTPFAFGKLASVKQVANLPFIGKITTGFNAVPGTAKATKMLEGMFGKIPSLNKPLTQARLGTTKGNIAAGLLKKPLVIDTLAEEPVIVYESVSNGEWGRAAITTGLTGLAFFEGGPLGLGRRIFKGGQKVSSKAVFGEKSFFDIVSSKGGLEGDDLITHVNKLKKSNPVQYRKSLEVLKSLQAINLHKFGGSAEEAADFLIEWQAVNRMRPINSMTAGELLDDLTGWFDNTQIARKAFKANPKLAQKIGIDTTRDNWEDFVSVGVFDKSVKKTMKEAFEKAADATERQQIVEAAKLNGIAWTENANLLTLMRKAAVEDDWAAAIDEIGTAQALKGVPKGLTKQFTKGYFPIFNKSVKFIEPEDAGAIQTRVGAALAANAEDFAEARSPLPGFEQIGKILSKSGLSPQDTTKVAYKQLRSTVHNNLDELDINFVPPGGRTKGEAIVDDLTDYINGNFINKENNSLLGDLIQKSRAYATSDLRQLTLKEISTVLNISRSQARKVRGAITQAYMRLPLELRGLGDRIQDINLWLNPAARGYSRAQNALRYVINPFFRTQEVFETEILGQALVGGKRLQLPGTRTVSALFSSVGKQQVDDAVDLLEERGFFAFRFSGEGAQDAVLGRITANISRPQKESLGGLLATVAKRHGKTIEQVVDDNTDEVLDMMRVVVQYPERSALNSALMRTMNLIAFPTRYNVKVTQLAARTLAQQPAVIQLATLKSISDLHDWAQSEEGKIWQSEHSEILGLFKWITPIGSVQQIFKLLEGPESVSDLGMLGGLPFGFIGQILEGQGLIELNTPYLDPKTGDVFPDYVPVTQKARLQKAITDMLMQVYTYPGRIVGLPGKGAQTREFVEGFLPTDTDEFEQVFRTDITEDQRRMQEALLNNLRGGPAPEAPEPYNGFILPPVDRIDEIKVPPKKFKQRKSRGRAENFAQPINL